MSDGAPRLSLYPASADDDPHDDPDDPHNSDAPPAVATNRRVSSRGPVAAIIQSGDSMASVVTNDAMNKMFDEPVMDADGPVSVPYANGPPEMQRVPSGARAPRQARLPTDAKATSFWVRRDHLYDDYKLWRAPRPRQVWDDKGKNTAAAHRPATNMDLILDLTMVVILARLGIQFRDYISAIDAEDLYDWPTCLRTIEQALLVFFSSFMILYSRWDRCVVDACICCIASVAAVVVGYRWSRRRQQQ
jgi:hypothetical protein